MPLRLGAVLTLFLLAGCGFDSFQFSGGRTPAQSTGGAPFQERGEADRAPSRPAPPAEGGEEEGEGEGEGIAE